MQLDGQFDTKIILLVAWLLSVDQWIADMPEMKINQIQPNEYRWLLNHPFPPFNASQS